MWVRRSVTSANKGLLGTRPPRHEFQSGGIFDRPSSIKLSSLPAERLKLIEEDRKSGLFGKGILVCEIRAVAAMQLLWDAQLLSHLRLISRRLGFLINFNVPLIKDGIKRFIL